MSPAAWVIDNQSLGTALGVINIVLIDIVLAGDNAVVIAMAARSLPAAQRLKGIALGAAAAVALRVALTFVAARLMDIAYLKLLGGLAITGIAIKLLLDGAPQPGREEQAKNLWQAMRLILVADITMSTDNVLAVAGASHGRLSLLIFGLMLSIPFVVFASNLLSRVMDRHPSIIWLGAAVLGRVAGEMVISDPWVARTLEPSSMAEYGVQATFALGVLAVGWLGSRRSPSRG